MKTNTTSHHSSLGQAAGKEPTSASGPAQNDLSLERQRARSDEFKQRVLNAVEQRASTLETLEKNGQSLRVAGRVPHE